MLNFYDTDAVKAYTLNILLENRDLIKDRDFERRQSSTWFKKYQEANATNEATVKGLAQCDTIKENLFGLLEELNLPSEANNQIAVLAHALADAITEAKGGAKHE